MTCAKGMTNGTIPMGGVFVARSVHDAVMEGSEAGVEFFHGYTYSGNPAGCAAGMAALSIYDREDLFTAASRLADVWHDAIQGLRRNAVTDIRTIGFMAAIDIDASLVGAGQAVFRECFENGVLVRAAGNTIVLSPPLVATEADIETTAEILGRAMDAQLGVAA